MVTKPGYKGFTLLELMVVLVLLSLALTVTVPGLRSYFNRMEISTGLRTATVAIHTARFRAIRHNKRIKLKWLDGRFVLMEKPDRDWLTVYAFKPVRNISFSMSAYPVFSPYGSVSPLCSIYVENTRRRYKVTISMAGRVKVTELESPGT
jgi:prepilin-type N-terminal cleavage/methylation domain-containing protein